MYAVICSSVNRTGRSSVWAHSPQPGDFRFPVRSPGPEPWEPRIQTTGLGSRLQPIGAAYLLNQLPVWARIPSRHVLLYPARVASLTVPSMDYFISIDEHYFSSE